MKNNQKAQEKIPDVQPGLAPAGWLDCAAQLDALAENNEITANKCDAAKLPPEYADWERGKASAYRISADTIRYLVAQSNAPHETLRTKDDE
jgi:hypothetical protein